ncbi:MAG: filamentous hemagglutinin N-terminal domain-containing protein [Xenococcaceae cyanobacterium MO_188.B29]|nr:filamentous hemagglutinin N-terminal domain-containing protein [Xenococcaceae cyanobacterium MO_188.B29]
MKPLSLLLVGLFLGSTNTLSVRAQITVDGTTNSTLTPTDNGIRIDDGDRAGDNLFHSFEQFSVLNRTEAFFNNPSDIVNIFSRVTGGNISSIDGLIRANGTANLFLLNPAGIIFGENASLNIGGSFVSSTADSIVFSDNVEFLATDADNPPLLTINMPIGLNFGNNPRNITVNDSNLQVNNGETLALLGGNVTITGGQIIAPGAKIELGGLIEAGQVRFIQQQSEDNFSLDSTIFPDGIARSDLILTNGAEVNVQTAGGGSISVNARNLEISGGKLGASNLRAGIAPESGSTAAQAGDITLNATDNITVSQGSTIRNRVEQSGVGNAGGIDITTTNLFLTEKSFVSASTFGQGDGGNITIEALGTISVDGESQTEESSGIFSAVGVDAVGTGGRIDIKTTDLSLTQGGRLISSTRGQGDGGAIIIEASGTIWADGASQAKESSGIFSTVESTEIGDSGKIDINTANLYLTQGGIVSASTFGQGDGGEITINVDGTIWADGESQAGESSGIFSIAAEDAIGTGGKIDINTANLYLTQGGVVTASTFGVGNAGNIIIQASDTISADGESQNKTVPSGIFSIVLESGVGNANDININTNNLSLTNEAEISVESLGQGSAGNLFIVANSLTLENGATLSASTPLGTGGDITLDIAEDLTLRDNSTISAQALGDANGGNININAGFVLAFPSQNEGNDIIANAQQGRGGDITITTQGIFGLEEGRATDNDGNRLSNGTNDIDPSSQFGLNGTITINELEDNPAEGIEDLPRFVIDPDKLVVFSLCSLARDSEFYYTAKGGNAPNLAEIRDEGVIAVDLVEPVPFGEEEEQRSRVVEEVAEERKEIVEAQGWIFHENGVVELVAYKTDINGSPAQPKDPRVCSQ